MWSDRSRSLTTMQTSTIRHGASRSKRRCGPHRGAKKHRPYHCCRAGGLSAPASHRRLPVNNRGKYRRERRIPPFFRLCLRPVRAKKGRKQDTNKEKAARQSFFFFGAPTQHKKTPTVRSAG